MNVARQGITVVSFLSLVMLGSVIQAGEIRHQVGASYITGLTDVSEAYEQAIFSQESERVESTELPIGPSYKPYYLFDNQVMLGVGVGPMLLITGDVEHTELPILGYVGYQFQPKATIAPYARVGVSKHLISGDYSLEDETGIYAALGIEFGKREPFGWGIELAMDDASQLIGTDDGAFEEEIESVSTSLSVFAIF